jgi:predicted esterase
LTKHVQYLKVEKTARFFASDPLDGDYRQLCFCLHGYGQLAEYFIRKFHYPELADTLFIAPEGFHRFYLSKSSGRVGASWMTKEDRLNDIEDYVNYLDQVYASIVETHKSAQVGLLGFSQGAATACRWMAQGKASFDYMANWAGAFPPDLDFAKAHERLEPMRLLVAVGDADEFISEDQLETHLQFLREKQFKPEVLRFEGKHDIYKAPLLELFDRIG